jgi:hypothetical protein
MDYTQNQARSSLGSAGAGQQIRKDGLLEEGERYTRNLHSLVEVIEQLEQRLQPIMLGASSVPGKDSPGERPDASSLRDAVYNNNMALHFLTLRLNTMLQRIDL